ncbi:hypothetical protein HK101_009337 [Irineochytrium annulatum]|nr:hypothetical protein HK101_009337 [Irineochytrium annulatum]
MDLVLFFVSFCNNFFSRSFNWFNNCAVLNKNVNRFTQFHFIAKAVQGTITFEDATDLFSRTLVRFSHFLEFLIHFFIRYFNVLRFTYSFKHQVVANTFGSIFLHLSSQVSLSLAREAQEHFKVHTLVTQTVVEITHHVLYFAVNHCSRNVHFSVLSHFFYNCIFLCSFGFVCFTGFQLCFQVSFVLFKRVKFANIFSKLIIQCRKLFALDFVNFHFEYRLFASKFCCMVALWESHFNVFEVTCGQTHNLLFKSRNECVGTQFQGITLSLSTFERYTINGTVEVDYCNVAVSSGTFVKYNEFSVTLLKTLKFFIHVCFSYFTFCYSNFDSFVLTQSHFSELFNIYVRTINREDIRLVDCFCISFRKQNVDCFLIKTLYTKTCFEDGTWYFTFTESSFVECCGYTIRIHFNLKNPKFLGKVKERRFVNLRLICHSFQNLNNLKREFLWFKRHRIDLDFNLLFASRKLDHTLNTSATQGLQHPKLKQRVKRLVF